MLAPASYPDQILDAGGVPVVLPPAPECARAVVERLDGLVLTGGPDLDPARYGAEPHPRADVPRGDRDEAELALLEAATVRGLPVLGICRGIQLVNVARGGTLHQHLPDVVGHEGHAPVPRSYGRHAVRIDGHSRLADAMGGGPAVVPTHHHQGIDHLGRDLVATAWAEDGTIEAVEDPGHHFLLAVQWHPEVGDDPSLFRAFLAAAHRRARVA